MNKQSEKIFYSEDEKKIFTDYFIYRTEGSRNIFKEYVTEFFNTLPLAQKPSIDTSKQYNIIGWREAINRPMKLSIPDQVQFNTHQILWDAKTKDNLVTHFLQHPDFKITNNSLHKLNFLHPDWNHQNKNGLNALMILAQNKHLLELVKVAKDFKLDLNKQDKDDKYFTHFLFSNVKQELDDFSFSIKYMENMKYIEQLVQENPLHFEISLPRLDRIINQWNSTLSQIANNFEDHHHPNMSNSALTNLLEQGQKISNKMLNQILITTLSDKNNKVVIKKI